MESRANFIKEGGMRKLERARNMKKRLLVLVLALAMVFTSVSVPSVTAEAAKNVKVKKVQITSPKKKKVTLVKGKTLQIKVKVTPKNAKNKKVTYKSSKKKIASVSKKGKVKGLKKGTAKITVTAKDGSKKKATLTVKVVNPVKVTKVTVSPAAAAVDVGKTVALKAACAPKNATNKAVSWKTSDKGVATVNAQGVVTGVKGGTATITATAKDGSKKSGSCTVTVKAAAADPNPNPNPNPPAPAAKTLEGIEVTKAPMKTSYYKDEKFDPAGMEVTASYSDKSTKALAANEYTLDPSVDTPLKTSDKAVTVSYTEGNVTKTATTPIKVETAPTVKSIKITKAPTKTEYMEGDVFEPAGMVVEAEMSKGEPKILGEGEYTYSKEPLKVTAGTEKTKFEISYKVSASKTVTAEVEILVKAKNELTAIEVELLKKSLPRKGGHFQEGDIKVMASFKDIAEKKQIPVADCIVVPDAFELTTTSATVSYWYGGVKKDQTVTGFTVTEYKEGCTFEDLATIGTVVKRPGDGDKVVPTEEGAAGIEIPETAFVEGIKGKALKMDGTYGLRLDNIAGTKSDSYSISMWVKPDSLKNCQALVISTSSEFGLGDSGQETWCAVAGDNDGTGSIKLWSRDTKGFVEEHKQGKIPVGENAEWSHIALVVDGTTTKAGTAPEEGAERSLGTLYVNGKKIYSGDVANEKANDRGSLMKTYMGVTGWSADGYYAGLIDELVFTNEVLTDADVNQAYLEGLASSGKKITAVSPDNGKEIEIEYGTSLADLKDELVKIAYKAQAEGEDGLIALPTTAEMWTVDNYTVTSEGTVNASVNLQAPAGYLFSLDGQESVSVTKTVRVKIKAPVIVKTVTPSKTALAVPFGTSQEAIKEELAGLTFTVTTEPSGTYEFENLARKWTLTETAAGYTATFDLGTPDVGYKFETGLAVSVNVTVAQAVKITGLTASKTTVDVAYGTPENAVKAELAKLVITAAVAAGDTTPESIENKASLWTLTNYTPATAGNYKAAATFEAPVGYEFSDASKAKVEVTVVVAEKGQHVLSSLAVETPPAKTKYIEGDDFDKTGMVVKAYFADGQNEDVTAKVTLAEATNMAAGKTAVTISYTAGEVTKDCEQEITVVKVEDGADAHYTFDDTLADAVDKTKAGKTVKNKDLTDTTVTDIYSEDGIGEGKSLKVNQNNAVKLPDSISKEQKAFTINLWVKKSAGTTSFGTILMGKTDSGVSDGKGLVLYANPQNSAGEIEMQVSQAATDPFSYNWKRFAVPMEEWKMLTFVNRQDGMDFYVDGVQQELTAEEKGKLSVTNGIDSLFLGAGKWTANEYLVGSIDEVRIYGSSLKESQVKALYDSVTPVISGISVDAKAEDFTFLKADVENDQKPIQDALKKLKINVTMKNGAAPEIDNSEDWDLAKTTEGYTATKKVTIPKGYDKVESLKTTLKVDVIVRDLQLESIALTKKPTKVNYAIGETFDPTGMIVTATYNDKSTRDVTKEVEITQGGKALTPDDGNAVTGKQTVTISFTEGGVTKTLTQEITVINPSTPKGAMLAARTAYYTFDGTLEDSVKNNTVGKTVKITDWGVHADTNLTDIYSEATGDFMKGKSLAVKKDVGVEIPESISKENKEFTINLWVKKKEGTAKWGAIFHGKNEAAFGKGLVMYAYPEVSGQADASKIQLAVDGENYNSFSLANDTWAMLTFVNKEGSMEFYIDGVAQNLSEEDKKKCSVDGGIDRMILGVGACGAGEFVVGNIDEVSIYNASLTADQIKLLKEEVQPTQGQ